MTITLLNDSEPLLNKNRLRTVNRKSNASICWKANGQPFYVQFKVFPFIYPHKETNIGILKIGSENLHSSLAKTNYYFGSHLEISVELNRERLHAPWRALTFRVKALEHTFGLFDGHLLSCQPRVTVR